MESHEIRQNISRIYAFSTFLNSFKNSEFALQIFIKRHDCSDISTSIAIIGSTPNSHQIIFRSKPVFVTLLH